jgi:hypothetical protein
LTIKKGIKLALEILEEIQGKKFDIKRFELVLIKNNQISPERILGEDINKL